MLFLTTSNKNKIYYKLISGESDGPYLVFLHEGLGCASMWHSFPEQLCHETGCPGLLYDRTGYGHSSSLNSDRTIHYVHNYALNELPEVINAVIPGKPHILIGHSDGGSISLIYGSENPPLLRGIVTEAAHVYVEPETVKGIRAANDAYELGKFEVLSKYHGEKAPSIFKAWSNTWLSDSFSHWNIEYLLPSITCPMLVIQGRNDQYGTEHQVHSIVSKSSGHAESYIIDSCGHTPHLEHPQKVIEKISMFLAKIKKT